MILPVYAYGQPILKKLGEEIDASYPNLKELLENMWETMYNASGVGLAAPQIGLAIRLFLVDTIQILEDNPDEEGVKQAFFNAHIIEETGDEWAYEEGCLSIPHIRGDVERPASVTIRYFDEEFKEHTKTFEGINARVIQHEYDHIDGVLFVEKLKPIKRRMITRKLEAIKKGEVSADYKLKFKKNRR